MTEQLSINSDIFSNLREQFDIVLNSLISLTGSSDEAELTLKLKLNKEYPDVTASESTALLKASWDITRTIKAKKFKIEGRVMDDYLIKQDDTGNVYVTKMQTSLFDEPASDEDAYLK